MTALAFEATEFVARAAQRRETAEIQAFYEANPNYHRMVNGEEVGPNEAHDGFDDLPPPEMPYTQNWWLIVRGKRVDGTPAEIIGSIDVTQDLLAKGVWHIGFFMLAEKLHGGGWSQRVYDALETWILSGGAQWIRLGVVDQNTRARRFWQRNGYHLIKTREGVAMGRRRNTVHVMIKPVAGFSDTDYLARVAYDRPE